MVSSLFIYLYIYFIYFHQVLGEIVGQVGRGSVGQKEKQELARVIIAALYIP